MPLDESYNPKSFTPQDPVQMMWARRMWDWDTKNPFAAGYNPFNPQTGGPGTHTPGLGSSTPSGVRLMNTSLPVADAPRASARPVNMLQNTRNLSFGGRNYGTQSIDRGEWDRFGSTVGTIAGALMPQGRGSVARGVAVPGGQTPNIFTRTVQKWRQRNVPPPPDYSGLTGAERMANAQARTGAQPSESVTPGIVNETEDVTAGSRAYQERVAEERRGRATERAAQASVGAGGAPPPPGNETLTGEQRMGIAGARRRIQQASRVTPPTSLPGAVPSRPAPIRPAPVVLKSGGTEFVSSPSDFVNYNTLYGQQAERLSAEGVGAETPAPAPKKKSTRKKA